jgi:predicted double-glycine peptidase
MTLLITSLAAALSLASAATGIVTSDQAVQHSAPGTTGVRLDVPYLSQTEGMCGGAAAAMLFRYWGEAHADIQAFAALADKRAGGITTQALVDAVDRRGWQTRHFAGSIDLLREELQRGRPVVILIQDRPGRYHFVVVTGVTGNEVIVHDPAWGPSRPVAVTRLLADWKPTGFWSLLILPEIARQAVPAGTDNVSHPDLRSLTPASTPVDAEVSTVPSSTCDRLLAAAVDEVGRRGLAEADAILGDVRARCPAAAGPVRELAAVRFAERRWPEASALAQQAVARDPEDGYAWDVLASSRFIQNDLAGALRAWNQIGKPRVDSVRIEGLERTKYALVAEVLDLPSSALLTEARFLRAERRLAQMPDRRSARIGFTPQIDGFARVDVAVAERRSRPRGRIEWAAAGMQVVLDREVEVSVPGWRGDGDLWTGSWRWWDHRPRVAVSFATPRVGTLPGVWRVEGSWEAQTYGIGGGRETKPTVREEHTHGGVATTDWIHGNLRYELTAGLDSWNGVRRAVSVGALLDRRWARDRLSVAADARVGMPLTTDPAFRSAGLRVTFRSLTADTLRPVSAESVGPGSVFVLTGGFDAVSAAAPLALWPGAGEGRARRPLLRAHPLLVDGVISGPMFGERLAYANAEAQQWFEKPLLVRIGLAAFADVAHVWRPLSPAAGPPFQGDVGLGLRLKAPGRRGILRIDFGRGLRDGADALTLGWQF